MMDEVLIASKIVMAFMVLYAILSAVECGVGFFKLFPHLLKSNSHVALAFHPIWKISTLFLVAGLGSMWLLFADANQLLEFELRTLAVWVTIFLALRWALYLYLFFRSSAAHTKTAYALYLLLCLTTPILLSVGAAFLLNGELGINPLSITLAAISSSVVLWGSSSFMLRHPQEAKNTKLVTLAHFLAITALLLTGVVLPWVAMAYAGQLYDNAAFSLIFLVVGSIGLAWAWMTRVKRFSWAWPLVIVYIIGIFAVLRAAHWPYLLFPDVPLDMVYTGHKLLHNALTWLVLAVILGGPGLYWIYRLAQNSKKGK